MSHSRRILFIPLLATVLIYILMPPPLLAENASLTLKGAVDMALERNSELRRLQNQVTLDEVGVDQARAGFRPSLNLSVGPSERFGRTFDQSIGQVETQRSESLNLNASSSINLFNGYADQAAVEAARLDLEASRQELERSRQRIAYDTAARFLGVFTAEELIAVERENVTAQRQQLDRIRAYWEQGTRSRTDLLQQKAALASAELRLLNAEQSRQLAELQLKNILQIDLEEKLTLTGPELAEPESEPVDYNSATLTREALARRHDVEGQKLRIAAAGEQVRQSRAGLLPKLNLSMSGGTGYSSLNDRSGFKDQLIDLNPSASIGFSLSLPLFDRRSTRNSIARSQVQYRNEQISLENLERGIALDVQQALLAYRTALKRLSVAAAQQSSAAEAMAAMEARYHNGSATFVELSQTRAQYVDAMGSRIQALYDATLARLAVEFNRGGQAWQTALLQLTR